MNLSMQQGRVYTKQTHDLEMARIVRDLKARQYATSQPTYPGGGPLITLDTSMRFPMMIARALTDLVFQRFVADRILAQGSPEMVASGAVVFKRSESIFMDREPEQVGVRSEWPRSGETPSDWYAAYANKHGLEVPISDESRRRNDVTELTRAQQKLANSVVRYVDRLFMNVVLNDPAVQTGVTSGSWADPGTDKIADIQSARSSVNNLDLGYVLDTMVINPAQETELLLDEAIRNLLPREVTNGNPLMNSVLSGQAVPLLGLRQILVTNQLAAGTILYANSKVLGSITDEQPGPDEGYTGFDPGAGQSKMFVKTYREENVDESIIRGARFPAIAITEPKSALVQTGA